MSIPNNYQFFAPSAPPPPVTPQYCMVLVPQQYMAPAAPQQVAPQQHHDSRPPCKYGARCYRKNPKHFAKYRHPRGVMRRNQHPPAPALPPSPPPPPPKHKHRVFRNIGRALCRAVKVARFFI